MTDKNGDSRVAVRGGTAIVTAGNVAVQLFFETPELTTWHWARPQLAALEAAHPDGIVFLLINEGGGPPDAPTRAAIERFNRELGPKLLRLVMVVLGDSLRMHIIRAVTRGLALVTGHAKKTVIVATVREGVERVHDAAGAATPSRSELLATVQNAYSALGRVYPRE